MLTHCSALAAAGGSKAGSRKPSHTPKGAVQGKESIARDIDIVSHAPIGQVPCFFRSAFYLERHGRTGYSWLQLGWSGGASVGVGVTRGRSTKQPVWLGWSAEARRLVVCVCVCRREEGCRIWNCALLLQLQAPRVQFASQFSCRETGR